MMQKIIFAVLSTHVLILTMMWGGINALGCAVLLSVPILIGFACGFYQMGYDKALSKDKSKVSPRFAHVSLFRG